MSSKLPLYSSVLSTFNFNEMIQIAVKPALQQPAESSRRPPLSGFSLTQNSGYGKMGDRHGQNWRHLSQHHPQRQKHLDGRSRDIGNQRRHHSSDNRHLSEDVLHPESRQDPRNRDYPRLGYRDVEGHKRRHNDRKPHLNGGGGGGARSSSGGFVANEHDLPEKRSRHSLPNNPADGSGNLDLRMRRASSDVEILQDDDQDQDDSISVASSSNSVPSTSGSGTIAMPPSPALHCRLCNNDRVYNNNHDFVIHLTFIHYRERIMKRIKPPYECLKCKFSPQGETDEDKCDELLMHYGCEENVSLMYYRKENPLEEASEATGGSTEEAKVVCKICSSVHTNERLLVRHITLRHVTQELCDDLPKKPPYRCPYIDCTLESTNLHKLMLHYGIQHNVSMELYNKLASSRDNSVVVDNEVEVTGAKTLTAPSAPPNSHISAVVTIDDTPRETNAKRPEKTSPVSAMKDSTGSNSRLEPSLIPESAATVATSSTNVQDDSRPVAGSAEESAPAREKRDKEETTPKRPRIERRSSSSSEKLRAKSTESSVPVVPKNNDDYVCDKCKSRRTFVTKKSLNYHLVLNHYFSDMEKNGPHKCPKCRAILPEKTVFAKHFVDSHFQQYVEELKNKSPDKRSRDRAHRKPSEKRSKEDILPQTEPTPPTSGGKNDSVPTERVRKTVHKPQQVPGELTARQKMMRQWEQNSLESQKQRVEELEAKIEQMTAEHNEALQQKSKDFERWINQKEETISTEKERRKEAEKKWKSAVDEIDDLQAKVNKHQRDSKYVEEMLAEKHSLNHQLIKEKKGLEKQFKSLEKKHEENEAGHKQQEKKTHEMEKSLGEQANLVSQLEISLAQKDEDLKESENQLKIEKVDYDKKCKRLDKQIESHKTKVEKLTEEKKDKLREIREMSKQSKEDEVKLKDEIFKLSKENKQLKSKAASELRKEAKKNEDQSRTEVLENQLKDMEKQLETMEVLEAERNSFRDSLEQLQRILVEFDNAMKEKNEKVKELSGKLEDAEMNLEEAMKRLNNHQGADKEKRELQRKVKQLEGTLRDWEPRITNNANCISGLQKENDTLKKKIKDYEENNTGAEEELYELSTKIRKQEKELLAKAKSMNEAESEKAKAVQRLGDKEQEVKRLSSNVEKLESQKRELERLVRQGDVDQVELLKREVQNKENEMQHLQRALRNMKQQYGQMRQESDRVRGDLAKSKKAYETLERDYSISITQRQEIHSTLQSSHRQLVRTSNQLADKQAATSSSSSSQGTILTAANIKTEPPDNIPDLPDFGSVPDSSATLGSWTRPSASDSAAAVPSSGSCVDVSKQRQIVLSTPADSFEIVTPATNPQPLLQMQSVLRPPPMPPMPPGFHASVPLPTQPVPHAEVMNYPQMPATSSTARARVSGGARGGCSSSSSMARPCPSGEQKQRPIKQEPASSATLNTAGFGDEVLIEKESEDIMCGLCNEYDPPIPNTVGGSTYTTEWVGCDCERWYHKYCTGLTRFTNKFSCKSVKMRCQSQDASPRTAQSSGGAPDPTSDEYEVVM